MFIKSYASIDCKIFINIVLFYIRNYIYIYIYIYVACFICNYLCFTHWHDMIEYIYIYLTCSTSSGCIQPVWIYLNIINKNTNTDTDTKVTLR